MYAQLQINYFCPLERLDSLDLKIQTSYRETFLNSFVITLLECINPTK